MSGRTRMTPTSARVLPRGWRWVKLGEVCRFDNGDAYKESDWSANGVQIIRIQNLNDHDKPFNYWAGSLEDRVKVQDGDLLLAWSGTPGTSFGAHIWNRGLGVLNQHIFLVHTDPSLDKAWAKEAINHVLEDLIRAAHGAVGLAHVTKREVEALKIPLPPLPEQRRIAATLNEQMSAVDRARKAAEERLDAVNSLPSAFLRTVFPAPGQALPKGWRQVKLGEVCETGRGRVISYKYIETHPGPYPVYSSQTANEGIFGCIDTYDYEGECLTWTTDGANAGRVFYRNGKFNCTNVCGTVKPRVPEVVYLPFLAIALNELTPPYVNIASGNPKLMNGVFERIQVPLPPLSVQRLIALDLGSKVEMVKRARNASDNELAAINALPAALLRRAFNGEI